MHGFNEASELAVAHQQIRADWDGEAPIFRIEFGLDLKNLIKILLKNGVCMNSHVLSTWTDILRKFVKM